MKKDGVITANEEQKEAIEYRKGPSLIIAGAGTGKTRVIVEKIAYLIRNNLAKPEDILALTFTEKAASEMEKRVDEILPYGYFQMWISTFHAFADQILKEEAHHIGISADFRLMTEAESLLFLRKHLFLLRLDYFRPLGNPNKFLKALNQHFSRLKDENILPEEYLTWAKKTSADQEQHLELAHTYNTYQKIKMKENVADFSDLMYYLLRLLQKRPGVLKKFQTRFRHVLVDEFQDTNIAQYHLIKLLCPPLNNPFLTVVGDDSQAIYKFRGASISNILTFMEDYPNAKQITLRKNYRSNQNVLDAAYRLIKNNDPDTLEAKLGISKSLIAQKEDKKNSVRFFIADTGENEADTVADEIIKLRSAGYAFSDCAILVRANNHADAFSRSLQRRGIPYQFLGPGMLFKQPEVKDLVAYLKFLNNVEDSVSLYRVISMDIFGIDVRDIHVILAFAKKINAPLFYAIEFCLSIAEIQKEYLPAIQDSTKNKLQSIYDMTKIHLTRMKKETAGYILYDFLEKTAYLHKLAAYKTEREEKTALNISKFFTKLKSFENTHEDASVSAVVDYIDMSMELGESPASAEIDMDTYDAVHILTVHSAKGLEFPVVFLVNLTQGRFPTYGKKESIPLHEELIKEILPQGDYHLQEERRLFYVGVTRAQDIVYLSAAQKYGEGKRERKISPFVYETLSEDIVKKNLNIKKEEKIQLAMFDFKKTEEPVVKKHIPIHTLSFSQIDTYETCPLQYKYRYVLKIPTPASHAASFGETIHKTLQKFYQEILSGGKPDGKHLTALFHESWIPFGYQDKQHEQTRKKKGEEMLALFFKTFHNPHVRIIALEKPFKIKIDADTAITGKIDRVDAKPGGEIEIIDYKTGKKPDEKKLKNSLQLSLYALAAEDARLFGKKPEQTTLTFYYLDTMESFSMKKTDEDMTTVKEHVLEAADSIRSDSFEPIVGPQCDFCPFRMICEAW